MSEHVEKRLIFLHMERMDIGVHSYVHIAGCSYISSQNSRKRHWARCTKLRLPLWWKKWGGETCNFPYACKATRTELTGILRELGKDKYSERKRKAGIGGCVLWDGEAIVHREFRMPIKQNWTWRQGYCTTLKNRGGVYSVQLNWESRLANLGRSTFYLASVFRP